MHVCAVVRVWSYVLCVVLRSNITIILTKHAYVLASRLPLFSPSSPPLLPLVSASPLPPSIPPSSPLCARYRVYPADAGCARAEDCLVVTACNPTDENQLLIGYEYEGLVLWDLHKRKVVRKFQVPPDAVDEGEESPLLRCAAWHSGGKQFVAGFENGAVVIWQKDNKKGTTQGVSPGRQISGPKPVRSVDW